MVRIKAFTLVEMLIVILIIMILIGLLIPGFDLLRKRAQRAQAQTTMATVLMAIRAAGASNARQAAGVEHPLAASAEPRLAFIRASDGSAVAEAGDAYVLSTQTWNSIGSTPVPPAQVLRPNDHFADPRFPALFGLARSDMRILGAANQWTTRYRELPEDPDVDDLSKTQWLIAPILEIWKDGGFERVTVTDPTAAAWEEAVAQTMRTLLSSHYDSLLDIGALQSFAATDGTLELEQRIVIPSNDPLFSQRAEFAGQYIKDGNPLNYRLRGTALYDPWGGEILFGVASNGAISAQSAGPSGVFVWHPGANGILETAADADSPSGDDVDMRSERIIVGDNS